MKGDPGRCPYVRAKRFLMRWFRGGPESPGESNGLCWTPEAQQSLQRVPEGFMRATTRQLVEGYAERMGRTLIDLDVAEAGIAEAHRVMTTAMSAGQAPGMAMQAVQQRAPDVIGVGANGAFSPVTGPIRIAKPCGKEPAP